jgi:diguanylate cyclase (GGDEF)-like protein
MRLFSSFARIDRVQVLSFLAFGFALAALYLISFYSYLLFHSLAEIFSIVIGCCIFIIAWHSRDRIENNSLLFLGIAFLFVSGLDILHTLAYKGMGVFPANSTDLPTQLWIAARYMQSISILISPVFLRQKVKLPVIIGGYFVVTSALLATILLGYFPRAYIEGIGLTPFKIDSEYIISLILIASVVMLIRNDNIFDKEVKLWIILSLIFSVVSELTFTSYIGVYGSANSLGHVFKILAFYFMYKAIIEMGLERPHRLLFRDLKQNEAALETALGEVRRLADTDSLTGLNNYRHFLDLAEHEAQVAMRYRHALSAIMIDVDRFKQVNDTYGHQAGDRLLQTVADCIRRETRETDVLGRLGGDEFAVLLPETDLTAASLVAAKIHARITAAEIETDKGAVTVTACIGVACLNGSHPSITLLLDSADQALYQAKRNGRNQVSVGK